MRLYVRVSPEAGLTVTGCPFESTSKLISMPRLKRRVARRLLLLPPEGESSDSASPDPAPAGKGDDPDRLTTLLIRGRHASAASFSLPAAKQHQKPKLNFWKISSSHWLRFNAIQSEMRIWSSGNPEFPSIVFQQMKTSGPEFDSIWSYDSGLSETNQTDNKLYCFRSLEEEMAFKMLSHVIIFKQDDSEIEVDWSKTSETAMLNHSFSMDLIKSDSI